MYRLPLATLLLVSCALAACGDETTSVTKEAGGPPVILTTFYPTTYLTERLAGDAAVVECPIPADEDPIFYRPTDDVVRRYQGADLIVINGAAFEKWVLRTSLPESRIVNTARPFRDRWLTFKKATEHSHGPSGKHAHEGLDGHTWLDPENAKAQAAEIAKALKRLLPDEAVAIDRRLAALEGDLDGLARAWAEASKDYAGETIYASHPAYDYLATRYGWTIENLDLDPETMPDAETFAAIQALLEAKPARHLIWESTPTAAIAKRFATDLGLESLVVSPCEMMSAEDLASGTDYLTVMHGNIETMTPALSPPN